MTFCPGQKQPIALTGPWDPDLGLDLGVVQAMGAVALVTLMEAHELQTVKVAVQLAAALAPCPGRACGRHRPLCDRPGPARGAGDGRPAITRLSEIAQNLLMPAVRRGWQAAPPAPPPGDRRPGAGNWRMQGAIMRTILVTVLACGLATVIIRHGPLEPGGPGEATAIALVWLTGVLRCLHRVVRGRLWARRRR